MSFGAPKYWEQFRTTFQGMRGDKANGLFIIKPKRLAVIISNGESWEHASVSRRSKCPSYDDMEYVKQQLWGADACVMQLHVPAADHVNCHPYCLHLWRPLDAEIPRPPKMMVGPG